MSSRILEVLSAIPRGRGYRFCPSPRDPDDPVNPRDPDHDGVSADIVHRGEVVARAARDGATYCCGVTFEAFWRAHRELLAERSADEVRALIAEWFCPTMGHSGPVAALVDRGLGVSVPPAAARPGDLCQFWRRVALSDPSGHSVVFLGWGTDHEGARTIRYWSSQPATDGAGEHEEAVGSAWALHFVRVTPRDTPSSLPVPGRNRAG